jgi:signal peptidase I
MNTATRQNWFIRRAKRLALWALLAVAIVVPVRAYVITPYRVPGDSVAPEIKSGSLVLVYRLASDFQSGDILAYRHGENTYLGRCESVAPTSLQVSRKDEHVAIPRDLVIGRVVLTTR